MSPEDVRQLLARLNALGGGASVRQNAAGRLLGQLAPADGAKLLHQVIALTRAGEASASEALPLFTRALTLESDQIPYLDALRRVAALLDADAVELLFASAPAQREYDLGAAARADAKLFSQSLGHLKTQARLTKNIDELSRLAVVSNAAVIRNVLINPRLTEEIVVRIAARRPARPEPLVEIWRSERWSVRPSVRRALAFNPYLPVEVGSKIVPLLSRTDLCELANDGGLHVSLRQSAQVLLVTADG